MVTITAKDVVFDLDDTGMVSANTLVGLNAKLDDLGGEINGVDTSVTSVADQLEKAEATIETLEAYRRTDRAAIDGLTKANKELKDGLDELTAQLRTVQKALESAGGTATQYCETLEDPANGSVEFLGDHGEKVPVGVTATFKCEQGFYVVGGKTKNTCQASDDGAAWSVSGTHPGCNPCAKDARGEASCAACDAADSCLKCTLGWLDGGVCKRGSGLQQGDAADSCLAIRKQNPSAETKNRGYWIKVKGMKSRQMWCLMDDFEDALTDSDDKLGGWTLVGRAVGGAPGCWTKAGDAECEPYGMWNVRKSFMYSNAVIDGIPHTTIRFQGTGATKGDFFWKAGSSGSYSEDQCEYKHGEAQSAACACAHQTYTAAEGIPAGDKCIGGGATGDFSDNTGNHLGAGSWIPYTVEDSGMVCRRRQLPVNEGKGSLGLDGKPLGAPQFLNRTACEQKCVEMGDRCNAFAFRVITSEKPSAVMGKCHLKVGFVLNADWDTNPWHANNYDFCWKTDGANKGFDGCLDTNNKQSGLWNIRRGGEATSCKGACNGKKAGCNAYVYIR